jgi:integrase
MELGASWQDSGFVFTRPSGAPIDPELVTKAFSKIAKASGFQGIRLHDLRHTHASLMMKAGINPKIVSERLGHSSIAVTMDIYSHVLPGLQE